MNYNITLKFNKKAISERSAIKYLGVMLDSSLTWHSQINLISKKLSRAIGLMYKIRPLVNPRIMKTLYYSLVYPYLIYAVEVWGSADDKVTDILLLLQKRIVQLLTYSNIRQDNFSFKSSNPLFFKEKILKIQDIFKMQLVKFIYNCLNKTCCANFHSWFKLTIFLHSHNTRSKYIDLDKSIRTNNLFIPTARTTHYGLKLIKVQGPKIWNSISPAIRNSLPIHTFINLLKISMFDSCNP